ncbi:hypothetical protein D0C36_12120 [Mucilaginibacter conchicola]|uniref:Zf-HC2 domain-containing protein n=1 Tax=Mucilaginibacter conchicola TaxID=2303333 RepID=A0A372NST0_9SPHI|nr:hypothetical protein [Mucilaginibacter conchicola]RFZ92182.1 hypothetical protein D0C36_12120 [Mucilaginibacter conchicola]
MNTIEEKLWNYIDGTCPPEEQLAIEQLIATDDVYRKKYDELLRLNSELDMAEMDEPSMGFTYNVMQAIRAEHSLQPLKSRIDGRVIWGIAAFFIITISALLVYAFSTVNWSAGNTVNIPVKVDATKLTGIFSGPVGKGFLFFDVVMGLFLLDHYLRRLNLTKQQ